MMLNQPATPAAEAEALPTPALPDINQPASPGPGPEGLPTPALPDINQPASPGPGPEACCAYRQKDGPYAAAFCFLFSLSITT